MTRSAATLTDLIRALLEADSTTVGHYDRRSRAFSLDTLHQTLTGAATVSTELLAAGVAVGQPVMVAANSPRDLWRGYLAGVLTGAVPALLPLRPTFDSSAELERKLSAASDQLPDAALLLHTVDGRPCIDPLGRPWVPMIDDSDDEPTEVSLVVDLLERVDVEPSTPLHLQFTSGSTGDSKPVVMTHGNVMANTRELIDRMEVTPDSHLVTWLPLYHDLGLVGSALVSLVAGANLRLLSPFDFLSDPTNWLIAIDGSPKAVSAAPNFALDYTARRVNPKLLSELDLSDWATLLCGAEPVDAVTVAAFLERFVPSGFRPGAMRMGYGLAESTLMVTMTRSGEVPKEVGVGTASISLSGPLDVKAGGSLLGYDADPDSTTTSITSMGWPAEDMTVEIVDADGAVVVADDVCGEVVVGGPSVSPGYRRPDGTIDSFPGGRCNTGDIGFFREGELYLVERMKNIIIRNGQNYSAGAFEQYIAQRAGIPLDRCAVIQATYGGDRILAIIEAPRKAGLEHLVETVGNVAEGLELPVDEVLIIERNGVPRTTSGKKQHALLRVGLQTGEIRVIERVVVRDDEPDLIDAVDPGQDLIDIDRVDTASRILGVVEEHARRLGWTGDRITEALRLRADLGMDSLAVIELVVDIDTLTGRSVPEARLADLDVVGDVVSAALAENDDVSGVAQSLERALTEIPQLDRIVLAQHGRQLRIGERSVTDFASVNYLGLDLHPEVMAAAAPAIERWGVHPSWTRAVASFEPYRQLEEELARLVGAPDVVLFPTITLVHIGVLPLLATGADTVVIDRAAHNSVREGVELAVGRGASLLRFDHADLSTLIAALRAARGRAVVALNGINSMTGMAPDLREVCRLASEYGAIVYVDDAHGIGLLGTDPTPEKPYGSGGGGVARFLGLGYENLVYVAGLSKAFSSMAAFVTCRDEAQRALFLKASTAIFSGPIPVASMGSALAALAVNEREGDVMRGQVHRLTSRTIEGARARGFEIDNELAFPIVNLITGDVNRTIQASKIMWEHGILFTPSVFPAAPPALGGCRISLTAANTDDDVDRLLHALDALESAIGPPPLTGRSPANADR